MAIEIEEFAELITSQRSNRFTNWEVSVFDTGEVYKVRAGLTIATGFWSSKTWSTKTVSIPKKDIESDPQSAASLARMHLIPWMDDCPVYLIAMGQYASEKAELKEQNA